MKRDPNEPAVWAVTNCYPSRVVLYAAAFHRGWRVEFVKSLALLEEAIREDKATNGRLPRAVVYDVAVRDTSWREHCSRITDLGIPFVVISQRVADETFLSAMSAGAFYAGGEPLCSEEILKALALAEDVGTFTGKPW